jgi:hypothetical protein
MQLLWQVGPHLPAAHTEHATGCPVTWSQVTAPSHPAMLHVCEQVGPQYPALHSVHVDPAPVV